MFVSFVPGRGHRGLLAKASVPKEAGRTARGQNEEEECAALAGVMPTQGARRT
jgi:hypothetical protein